MTDGIYQIYLGSPQQPKLENVIVTTTLDDFVSRIVSDVVMFVLLEQVIGAHPVAVVQQTLQENENVSNYFPPKRKWTIKKLTFCLKWTVEHWSKTFIIL